MAKAAIAGGDGELRFQAALGRFFALLELADPEAGFALNELEELADQLHQPRLSYLAASRRAAFTVLIGDSLDAERQIDAAHELGAALGEPDAYGVYTTQILALNLARGGAQSAGEGLARLPAGVMPPEFAPHEAALRHLGQGDAAAARAVLRSPRPVPPESLFRWRVLAGAAIEVEVDIGAGVDELLPPNYAFLLPYAATMVLIGGAVCAPAPVDFYLGLAKAAAGDLDTAATHLRDAIALADRLEARPNAARSRLALAEVVARQGDTAQARELAATAAEAAERFHLDGVHERAKRLLGQEVRPPAEFRRHGEVWALTFAGTTAQLADAKGLHDIAALLAVPGEQISATRLYGTAEPDTGADEVLDPQARAAYKKRLADLEEEIDEAESNHDSARAEKFRVEREALIQGLAAAYGLGGRVRRLGDPGERARTAVTARIRDALKRIERVHPALGRHLRESVSTGRSCAYEPREPVRWAL